MDKFQWKPPPSKALTFSWFSSELPIWAFFICQWTEPPSKALRFSWFSSELPIWAFFICPWTEPPFKPLIFSWFFSEIAASLKFHLMSAVNLFHYSCTFRLQLFIDRPLCFLISKSRCLLWWQEIRMVYLHIKIFYSIVLCLSYFTVKIIWVVNRRSDSRNNIPTWPRKSRAPSENEAPSSVPDTNQSFLGHT
jgi:hypothetical protein